MTATLDLPAVSRFAEELGEKMRRCDNGEGMACATLDARIRHYVELCDGLRALITEWAEAVFTGQSRPNPAVDFVLKGLTEHLLQWAQETAAQGRAMEGECAWLQDLNKLHYRIADFAYLLKHWTIPAPSVSPAPRTKVPDAAARQIAERIATLPPLPSDWKPADPEQQAWFQKSRQE